MHPFPFSALVGKETLKRALLLAVIQPSLGGVLIRGTKGVAKSTAVRALASLLPPIETVAGCPFQRPPGDIIADWPLPGDSAIITRPVPLVELPLGATEDRVLGSLHLEKALRGERTFEPGLLAAANRGILYIDEVNLLPDHLVDILLDAAASGIHRVEREGLSLIHPARFVLIGTMNPEEGDLRPQLLDRFGLVVDVTDLNDTGDRAEAVRRRLAYESDPEKFRAIWQAANAAEAERIVRAQQRLPQVQIADDLLRSISSRCQDAGVEGLRADLTLCKAACAWAAYDSRTDVETGDVEAVAELALAHRRTTHPRPPQPPNNGSQRGEIEKQRAEEPQMPGTRDRHPTTLPPHHLALSPSQIFETAGLFASRVQPNVDALSHSTLLGRWRSEAVPRQRATRNAVRIYQLSDALAWSATLRAAAPLQRERQDGHPGTLLLLRANDLRGWPQRGPVSCLLTFVVDASGSMAAWQRMRQTKAAVLSLLHQAYQRRDRVALLAFRGRKAELILPPTRGLQQARRALQSLPVGGTTPLAHGLRAAWKMVRDQQQRQPRQPIWTVFLTDGRTNLGLDTGEPWHDALAEAQRLAALKSDLLVVDTETGWPRFQKAEELARAMNARYLPLEEVLGRPLQDRWRQAI